MASVDCEPGCRYCAWARYFTDDGPPPFQLQLPKPLDPIRDDKTIPASAFLDPRRIRRFFEDHYGDIERRRRECEILTNLFVVEWTWELLLRRCVDLATACPFVYVGITTDLLWRWWDCEGHNNGNMKCHAEKHDRMYALACDPGRAMSMAEGKLVAHLKETALAPKVKNADSYRQGPIQMNAVCYLYVCVDLTHCPF